MEHLMKFPRHYRRRDMPKRWKESRGYLIGGGHAPAECRRWLVGLTRKRENLNLRNAIANGVLEDYEPLGINQNDADWIFGS